MEYLTEGYLNIILCHIICLSMEDAHVKALETMREDYGIEWRELK